MVAFCFAQILLRQPVEGGVPDTPRRSRFREMRRAASPLAAAEGGKTPACKSAHKGASRVNRRAGHARPLRLYCLKNMP